MVPRRVDSCLNLKIYLWGLWCGVLSCGFDIVPLTEHGIIIACVLACCRGVMALKSTVSTTMFLSAEAHL